MKKCLLFFGIVFATTYGNAQALITYGKNSVSKDEFIRAYNKNKTQVDNKEKAIREYVGLYTNFKLKVKAAEDLKLDTSSQLKEDLDNFRHQIENGYLNDAQIYKFLTDQAIERSQLDLHVVHYSVVIDPSTSVDTLEKYEAIKSVYNQLLAGKTDYESLIGSVFVKYADMGFITAFTLPYQYENIVYGLKVGETSKLYRSKSAWHIFKLIEKRKSAGKFKVAQILFTYPPESDADNIAKTKRLADSVYKLANVESNFSELAREFSDDKLTYMNGGEIPEFGTGKFDAVFESEVIKLKKEGEISKPFSTSFGVHIVKLISHTETPSSKTDDALLFDIKQKLATDNRISIAKDKFAKDIAVKIGLKQAINVSKEELFAYADTVIHSTDEDIINKLDFCKKTIFTFNKGNIKADKWLNYYSQIKSNPEEYKGETDDQIWEQYKNIAALEYYRSHLEEYNKDFAMQMQEFKEGNMLFDIMEKKVWSKASEDSVGMLKYYNENKEKYKWAKSADVLIMNCASASLAGIIMDSVKSGTDWKSLVERYQEQTQGDSTRFELSQIAGSENPVEGSYSEVIKNADGTATFVKYYKIYPDGQQRTFEQSKGMVINDYQNVIEKKWLDELKLKYPVKVNEASLQTIMKQL
jgi:peptidyl-prolyl cis-trans isomerase SurA